MHPVRSRQASLQGSVNLAAPAAPSTPNNQFWLAKSQFGGEPLANHIGGYTRGCRRLIDHAPRSESD